MDVKLIWQTLGDALTPFLPSTTDALKGVP
jgi:hypothetical protein